VLFETLCSFISPGTERGGLTDHFRTKGETPPPFPRVPGYQRVGRVLKTGANVEGIEEGQIVFAALCRLDKPTWMWGSHVALGVSPAEYVLPLPENVKAEEAAALVILQVGLNAASRPPVRLADLAVVVGDGLIGQFAAQMLRARGAYVILAGHRDDRLSAAFGISADEVVNTHNTDLVAWVRKRWPNGAEITVESVGRRENVKACVDILAHNGHYVSLGFYPDENPFDLAQVHGPETTIYNPSSFTRERLEWTLRVLAAGKFHVAELITHRLPWNEAPAAYKMITEGKPSSLGIVLDWQGAQE